MAGSVARNTFYLTAASVGQKLLAFGYFLAIARVFKPEETGSYFLALSVIIVAQVAADVGVANVVIRSIAQKPDEAVATVRHALAVKIPATVFAVIVASLMTCVLGHTSDVRWLVFLATAVLIADSFSLFFYAVLRGTQKLVFESIGMPVGQGITLLVGSAVLLFVPSLQLLVFALFAGSLFNAVFAAFRVERALGWRSLVPQWSATHVSAILRESFPFFLAAIFVKAYSYIDVQFLYAFLGTSAVGMYSIAYKYTYAFQFIPLAFSAALYPGMSSLMGKDMPGLERLLQKALRYMLLIAVPLAFGISAVSRQAVEITGGAYSAAAPVLAVMAFAIIPSFLCIPTGSLLNAGGRQSLNTALFGVTMVVNGLLNWILIPSFGMLGAAVASVISLSILFLLGCLCVPRVLNTCHVTTGLRPMFMIVLSGLVMHLLVRSMLVEIGEMGTVRELLLSLVLGATSYSVALFVTGALSKDDLKEAVSMFHKPAYAQVPSLDS